MAENSEISVAEQALKDVDGHDRIVIEDSEGNEYTLRYTRRIVKDMEKRGITAQTASDMLSSATLTSMEKFVSEFIAPAFKADQPSIKTQKVLDIWAEVPEKEYLISLLMALFMQPMNSLLANPTETRAKFRLV